MKNSLGLVVRSIVVCVGCVLTFNIAMAKADGSENDSPTGFEPSFNNPAPGIEMGGDLRWRYIYGENIDSMNDDSVRGGKWIYMQNRMRLWNKFELAEDVDFNTRLMWEFTVWDSPDSKPKNTNLDEALFDRFNITWRNAFGLPVTAVVGRQDIRLGKGWLVMEGTPMDGPRSIFMDAVRVSYNWDEANTVFDMVYVDQAAAADRWLKPFNDREKALVQQDEKGFIFYATNNSLEKTQLEGYFIYKNDNPVNTAMNFPPTWSKKAEIYTFGGAIDGAINDSWSNRIEAAVQSGVKKHNTLNAWGAKEELVYKFNDQMNNKLTFTYEYLSGDDPSTSADEAFDPLWGEWPQWSDLYMYCCSPETMIGEVTNLHRFGLSHGIDINKTWSLATNYNLLWAEENTYGGRSTTGPAFSTDGKFRGQLMSCRASFKVTENLDGHLQAEYFVPGDYYSVNTRDAAMYLRANIEWRF